MFTFLFVYLRDRAIRNTPPVKTLLLLPTAKSTRIEYQNYYPYSKLAYTQSQNVPYLTTTDTSQIPANCANQEDIFPPWVVISVLLSSEHLVQRINCKLDLPLRRRFSKISASWSTNVPVCYYSNIMFSFNLNLNYMMWVWQTDRQFRLWRSWRWNFLLIGKGFGMMIETAQRAYEHNHHSSLPILSPFAASLIPFPSHRRATLARFHPSHPPF